MAERKTYSVAISKGAALLEETRMLAENLRPGESVSAFSKRVQENGILGNVTAYRTRDIVHRVFAPRYMKPLSREWAIP